MRLDRLRGSTIVVALPIVVVLLMTASAWGQAGCQWLTQGSASTLLGAPAVVLSARFLPSGEGACTFSSRQQTGAYLLAIAVGSASLDACPAQSVRLKGIGNDAALCRVARTSTTHTSEVSGRVRTMYFEVTVTLDGPAPAVAALLKQDDLVEKAAEQVAGNLD